MARTYLTQPIVFNPALSYGLSIFDLRNNFAASYAVRLPFDNYFGKGDIAKRFTAGWSLAGLTTLASGEPVRLSESDDRDLVGDFSFPFDTPSAARNGSSFVHQPESQIRADPTSIQTISCTIRWVRCGDISRRFFSGPGIDNYNLSLLKDTQITEKTQLQFRAEAFNVFNHAQFNNPAGSINNTGTGGFGYRDIGTRPSHHASCFKISLLGVCGCGLPQPHHYIILGPVRTIAQSTELHQVDLKDGFPTSRPAAKRAIGWP